MSEKQADAKPAAPKPVKKPDKPMAPCQMDPAASFERVAQLRDALKKAEREQSIAKEQAKEASAKVNRLKQQVGDTIDDERKPNLFPMGAAAGIKVNAAAPPAKPSKADKAKAAEIDPNQLGEEWRTVLLTAVLEKKDAERFMAQEVKTLGMYANLSPEFLKGLQAKDKIGEAACKRAAKAVQAWFAKLHKERLKAQAKAEPAQAGG